MTRTSVIETDSPEWHSGARPSSYVRNDAWWVTLESNQAGTKAQALQARSVPRLDVTQRWMPAAQLAAGTLLLELDVPVQIVPPSLMQKIRREQTLGRHQVVPRRLERLA